MVGPARGANLIIIDTTVELSRGARPCGCRSRLLCPAALGHSTWGQPARPLNGFDGDQVPVERRDRRAAGASRSSGTTCSFGRTPAPPRAGGCVTLLEACLVGAAGERRAAEQASLYRPVIPNLWRITEVLPRIRMLLGTHPEGGALPPSIAYFPGRQTPVAPTGSSPLRPQSPRQALSQGEHAVAVRCHGVAMLAIGGMATAISHDPGFLLALDIAVDAGHPGTDLVHQLTLTEGQDVLGPLGAPQPRWPRSGSGRARLQTGSNR